VPVDLQHPGELLPRGKLEKAGIDGDRHIDLCPGRYSSRSTYLELATYLNRLLAEGSGLNDRVPVCVD
jgi:hypothetical protein